MSNLIVVCGPQAVGKMTVAESLRDKINYHLMVNHDSIEVTNKIFGFGTPAGREFNAAFREKVFELAIKHDVNMLFTYVVAFEMQEERDYLTGLEKLFLENGGKFYFVELSADLEKRVQRNETPHRMEMKPTKRNLEWSRSELLSCAEKHKLNLGDDEFWFENHIKIDNTNLEPDEVADIIIQKLNLAAKNESEKE